MRLRNLSVIALSNRDFSSFDEKLTDALQWIELAASQKSQLVVLPECLNRYCGDGAGNPLLQTSQEMAFADWQSRCAVLIEAARRLQIYLTIPVINKREGNTYNSLFLIAPTGELVWTYDKLSPTPSELESGVTPGSLADPFYDWDGVKIGGLICFDSCFPENLQRLAENGVELVLFPSLWPGGSQLHTFAKLHSCRVALAYPAWSKIIDIDGKCLVEGGYRNETLRFGFGAPVYTTTLNFDRVALYGNDNQERVVAILSRYGERVAISYDQENCLWFLDSRDPELSEAEILREFDLVPASAYFQNSRSALARFR